MVRKVEATIRRFAMLAAGDRVAAAVSGGQDSVALLHCLVDLAEKLEVSVGVVHVNHCLRGDESDNEERFVANLAKQLELPFESARLDAARAARQCDDNLEQAARKQRYRWFAELVANGRFDKIATGHTVSDQAETVLFRLLRGAAGAGLAGVLPVLGGCVVRPLADVTRTGVTRYLNAKNAAWREDSSNTSYAFTRNRIRHELLPHLERDWNPALSSVLAHTAEWARAEEEYWAEVIERLAASHLRAVGDGMEFSTGEVRQLPTAAARRLIRHAIERTRGTLAGIGFDHIEDVRSLAASRAGRGRVDLPGLRAVRSHDLVRMVSRLAHSDASAPAPYTPVVSIPGTYGVPGQSTRIELKIMNPAARNGVYNDSFQALVDWEKVPKPLYLRSWMAGDRIVTGSRGTATKLKSLFQQGRVPLWDRDRWPVLASSPGRSDNSNRANPQAVIWTRQFGASIAFAPDGNSRLVVEITEIGGRQKLGNPEYNS